jgi:hypothetical protein
VSDLVPVIRSDAHLAHTGLIELASGVEIPCFESPERILAIEAALEADGSFAFEPPPSTAARRSWRSTTPAWSRSSSTRGPMRSPPEPTARGRCSRTSS